MNQTSASAGQVSIPAVTILNDAGPAVGPPGVVYSTAPRAILAENGMQYIVKGHGDGRVVAAEALGHLLANEVGVCVPEFAIARAEDGAPLFASALVMGFRDVTPWLRSAWDVAFGPLCRLVVLDIWLANYDRNMGNLLARRRQGVEGEYELVAIDFEKSMVIKSPTPLAEIPTLKPSSFWPSGELGTMLSGRVSFDMSTVHRFMEVADGTLAAMTAAVVAAARLPAADAQSIDMVLRRRRDNLPQLAKEVWR